MSLMEPVVVWFSCGAASAVAAKLTVEKYGSENVRVVNNPIAEEDEDNRRFLADVQDWIGVPIELASHPDYPSNSIQDVWDRRGYMSGIAGASCTMVLKKQARQHWEQTNKTGAMVMGFTAEERGRHERFKQTERNNIIPILLDAGLTKDDCAKVITDAGLALPRMYSLGYPNANCPGCIKATSPTYWNFVRRVHPDVFADRAATSRRLGVKLVRYKGRRIFLDELPPDAKGRPMKSIKMPECGIFCEERIAAAAPERDGGL